MADRGRIRIGTSGWQYDDWDGAFYPDDAAKAPANARLLRELTEHG